MSGITPALLDQLGKQVAKAFPQINEGGCCVFASLVGAHLAKQFSVSIPVEYHAGVDIDKIRPQVDYNTPCEWNDCGLYFYHVVIELVYGGQTYYYDTRGCVTNYVPLAPTEDAALAAGRLTLSEATELASINQWNSMFDRSCIPELKSMIDRFFATI